jgi:hypothetical protein
LSTRTVLSLAFLLFATPALSQERQIVPNPTDVSRARISFGSESFYVGMPQERALTGLRKWHSVELFAAPGREDYLNYVIKSGSDVLGTIVFRDGVVTFVSKNWDPPQDSGRRSDYDYAMALYRAATSLVAEGNRVCTLDAKSDQAPRGEGEQMILVCGERTLLISASAATLNNQTAKVASITEMIGATPRR